MAANRVGERIIIEACFKASEFKKLASIAKQADYPATIYTFGNANALMTALNGVTLGIVGSRKMTLYGQKVIYDLTRSLKGLDVCIVSGFMYGADMCAHTYALDCGLKTVGVLGYGFDFLDSTDRLYEKMLTGEGGFVSEYSAEITPKDWTFVKRNRLISAFSDVLLVIEAAQKSGSIITAKYAAHYGKKVVAVPGNVYSEYSKGTNNLIKQGAAIYCGPEDIHRLLNLNHTSHTSLFSLSQNAPLPKYEKKILDAVTSCPTDATQLSRFIKLPIIEVAQLVSNLLVAKKITEQNGIYYAN